MLLEHNVPVYKQLINVLSNDNCACVVMGTGVGKSYVALEYLIQNKLTALVVSPRTSINASWEKLCGEKVDTITYQKLANIYKSIDYSFYDVVICDEVHHIGAPKWGEPIKFLIDSGKKVIGLTESSIRYTDGARDVADEFFHGNIVRGESVESAIDKKILNPVTYVGAMYNSDGLKKTIRGKIQSRLYAKLNLVLNNTPTVQEILTKNMPDGKRKGIIFASTINDINYAIDFMHSVYPDAVIKFVHSKRPAAYNAEVFDWFKKTKEGYICSVDMISEGVHIKGVNTLIMLRRTESLNLFNQQLGRCLDANSKEPAIIFDLVNNKYSIRIINGKTRVKTNFIFGSSKLNVVPSEQLIIKDYTKDIVEVLEEIKLSIAGKWTKEDIELMKKYYVSEGTKISKRLSKPYSYGGIVAQAQSLGLIFDKGYWSDEEEQVLIKNYPLHGLTYCSKLLPHRSRQAIKARVDVLHLKTIKPHHIPWSSEEDEIVREYYPNEGYEVLNRLPGRTLVQLKRYVNNNKIRRKISDWSPEEDEIVKKYFRKEPYEVTLSRLPGRTFNGLKIRGEKFGIYKFDSTYRKHKIKKRD